MKEADKDIIKHLKGLGRLIDSSSYTHSYPFCWRSDTPLIQRVCSPAEAIACVRFHLKGCRTASLIQARPILS